MARLSPLLPFALFALVIPLVIWVAVVARRRTLRNLQKLADEFGLELSPGSLMTAPRLAGRHQGRALEIFTYTTGAGKSRTTWAALTVALVRPAMLTFRLQKQGFGTKVMELFGSREITVGDPAFDAAWFVQTDAPELLAKALFPALRGKLVTTQREGANGSFEFDGVRIKYAERGAFDVAGRMDRFRDLVEIAGDLADALESVAERAPIK